MTFNKMHQSKILSNIDKFEIVPLTNNNIKLMRSFLDMFLLWQVIDYFKLKNFLEIGFAAGQTMGIIYESSGKIGNYLSVDINYDFKHIFEKVFPDTNIVFLKIDSKNLKFNKEEKFDFICIDGDHDYDNVVNDIEKISKIMSEETILYLDDYKIPSVNDAIEDTLIKNKEWVPFLSGDQGVFFHHISKNKCEFLDFKIQEKSKNFIYYINDTMYGNTVLTAKLPHIFSEHTNIFLDALKVYDI